MITKNIIIGINHNIDLINTMIAAKYAILIVPLKDEEILNHYDKYYLKLNNIFAELFNYIDSSKYRFKFYGTIADISVYNHIKEVAHMTMTDFYCVKQ